ncbi:MAG: flagellar assembly protein FliW, partial [Sedimenticolaceae bacterium]
QLLHGFCNVSGCRLRRGFDAVPVAHEHSGSRINECCFDTGTANVYTENDCHVTRFPEPLREIELIIRKNESNPKRKYTALSAAWRVIARIGLRAGCENLQTRLLRLQIESAEDVVVVVTLSDNQDKAGAGITANFMAPIIINSQSRIGLQKTLNRVDGGVVIQAA